MVLCPCGVVRFPPASDLAVEAGPGRSQALAKLEENALVGWAVRARRSSPQTQGIESAVPT